MSLAGYATACMGLALGVANLPISRTDDKSGRSRKIDKKVGENRTHDLRVRHSPLCHLSADLENCCSALASQVGFSKFKDHRVDYFLLHKIRGAIHR